MNVQRGFFSQSGGASPLCSTRAPQICRIIRLRVSVPATVTSLILYVSATAVWISLDFSGNWLAWAVRIFIIVCLVNAVQAAVVFQKVKLARAVA